MQSVPAVATRYCRFTLDVEAVYLDMLRPPVQFSEYVWQGRNTELVHCRQTFQEQDRFTLGINSERNEVVVSVHALIVFIIKALQIISHNQ